MHVFADWSWCSMSLSEFELIDRFFTRAAMRDDVVLGVGDDAALLRVPARRELAVAVDTLVAGRHFPHHTDPFDIGFKSLAVNLSDLAAMGASPAWATLALTLPEADESWLESFAAGFFSLADEYRVSLVGGDCTRGPLSITVQVHGLSEPGKALRRDAAKPGEKIFVTGSLGDAAYALRQLRQGVAPDHRLLQRLNRPQPRVAMGERLCGLASAAIDISDGLLADLGHVVQASGCGATLWVDRLPRSDSLRRQENGDVLSCQLNGGDDYELCFTADAQKADEVLKIAAQLNIPVTETGIIEAQAGIRCRYSNGDVCNVPVGGFDHFADENHDQG